MSTTTQPSTYTRINPYDLEQFLENTTTESLSSKQQNNNYQPPTEDDVNKCNQLHNTLTAANENNNLFNFDWFDVQAGEVSTLQGADTEDPNAPREQFDMFIKPEDMNNPAPRMESCNATDKIMCNAANTSLDDIFTTAQPTSKDTDTLTKSDTVDTIQSKTGGGDAAHNIYGATQPEKQQWVQCDHPTCAKWRKMSASIDMTTRDFFCVNCDQPEEEYVDLKNKFITTYCYHMIPVRKEKLYAVIHSDLAIVNELMDYLTHHTSCGIRLASDAHYWSNKSEKVTKWISSHHRQNKNSNEHPLDELLVIRACAAFQALVDCLRHWEANPKELSENKLQVIFERTFYPELFVGEGVDGPIPEDEAEKKTFMRSCDKMRGAKMSHGSMQNCFSHMLEFITGWKQQNTPKTTKKRKKTQKKKSNNNKKKSKTSE